VSGPGAVDLLRALIRDACVNDGRPSSGGEARAVDTLSGLLGAPDTVVEPAPGRQSAVWRVKGARPGAPGLLLMGHTDVVPVSEDGWSVDPFAAEVRDGFVWGRGAVDMLNLTAAMAVVFGAYRSGELAPLPGDLTFLAVADEEAAGGLGARPLVEERWDLVGAPYVLTEIAYPPIPTVAGLVHPVSVAEKGPHWSVLRSTGSPGHGSQPFGRDNALEPLARGLAGLFSTPSPVVISDVWTEFVSALSLPEDLTSALLDPDRVDEAIEHLTADDPLFASYVHACTHLTVSPNVVTGGVKANVIPDRAEAQVDLRALPGQSRADVDQHLRKAMGSVADRIEILPVADHPANGSGRDNPLWEAIVDGIESLTGSRRVAPAMMPATTDGRFFRDRGSVVYGVGLFDDLAVSFPEFLSMFHGNDERVSVASVGRTSDLLAGVVARFGELSGPPQS
jgi:acetylornithine deacetylase/succinyl-diaminopimelate desuccinylase-like protein